MTKQKKGAQEHAASFFAFVLFLLAGLTRFADPQPNTSSRSVGELA